MLIEGRGSQLVPVSPRVPGSETYGLESQIGQLLFIYRLSKKINLDSSKYMTQPFGGRHLPHYSFV